MAVTRKMDGMRGFSWKDCALVVSDQEIMHGEPVFKGTRLTADTVVDNVDAYLDEGLALDEAINETLENFPTVPGGASGIRGILSYRAEQLQQLAS